MPVTVITPAASNPITLADAKAHLRVTSSSEDDLITALIGAATAWVENYTGRSLAEKTLLLSLDQFSDAIELPRGPVQSVTSVGYVDADGATQVVPTASYTFDDKSEPQWVVRNSGASWPTTLDAINVVNITYIAGEDPPQDLRHALLLLIGEYFDNREAGSVAASGAVEALCRPYRALLI